MAKETKKAAEQQVENTTTNVDNLIKNIEDGTKFDKTLAEQAEKELKEEKDKEKISQIKSVRCQADYTINRELLKLRQNRDEEEVIKEAVKKIGELKTKVFAGEITPMTYEKELFEVGKEKNKQLREIQKKYDSLKRQLRSNYPSYRVSEWEYENWTEAGPGEFRSRNYNW